MKVPIYQVDAFTHQVFHGNPAAVCVLQEWLPDAVLQNIAAENNLSETAFIIENDSHFEIRWFTPVMEVDLCGHATLASAHVIFQHLNFTRERIRLSSQSGWLHVFRKEETLFLDFPNRPASHTAPHQLLIEALAVEPKQTFKARDYLLIFDKEEDIKALNPDFTKLMELDTLGIIVSAPGNQVDFVSRFFAPGAGINEDPVTGSAHCTLIPYWAEKLGKKEMVAKQISARGGDIICRLNGDRVEIGGKAVTFLTGEIEI